MRNIRGVNVIGLANARCEVLEWYKWEVALAEYVLDVIEFTRSMIEAECFRSLLLYRQGLRIFRYAYDNHLAGYLGSGRSGSIGWWEPKAIIEILLEHASHSLVHLDLTGCDKAPAGSYRAGPSFIGSLRGFEKLKTLRTGYELFIESQFEKWVIKRSTSWNVPIYQSEQEEIDRKREVEGMHPDNNEWKFAEIQVRHARFLARFNNQPGQKADRAHHLIEVLPASIVKLRLCMPFRTGVRRALFDGFHELKGTRLPNLRAIAFEDVETVPAKFMRVCELSGVELELQGVADVLI